MKGSRGSNKKAWMGEVFPSTNLNDLRACMIP